MRNDKWSRACLTFSRGFSYDRRHCLRSAVLSLQLFDQLKLLHGLPAADHRLLYCAALLHDIGWQYGGHDHHKKALSLIINSPDFSISTAEKIKIGLIARYHRGNLPRPKHPYYQGLNRSGRRAISWLGAMLRLADSLDHERVKKVKVRVNSKNIVLAVRMSGGLKKDLLEKISKRKVNCL
jgi:exopolyphosphatase / guanosine-5'-triphosphate,3'-diphosphate pyrophosphatase